MRRYGRSLTDAQWRRIEPFDWSSAMTAHLPSTRRLFISPVLLSFYGRF